MRKFAWRLERLLSIKTIEERREKAELLALTEESAQQQSELLFKKRILQNIAAEINDKDRQHRIAEQAIFLKYSVANDEQIKKLQKNISELEEQKKVKIAEVVKIRRFKEGLEKLREKAKREFIYEQEKLEQNASDEETVTRFARQMQTNLETEK